TDTDSTDTGGTTASCSNDTPSAHVAAVVDATDTFLEALTSAQQDEARYDLTLDNAIVWSNLPVGAVPRNGVAMEDMSAGALAAALDLAAVAAGDQGGTLLIELRAADEYLSSVGMGGMGGGYGEGLYYVAIHGEPSTSDPWMLQIGGHHLAYNFMFNSPCTSATPQFDGAEPMDWTDDDNVDHSPLEGQRGAAIALLAAVSGYDGAALDGSFGDLVNGPSGMGMGGGDIKYPDNLQYPTGTEGRGVPVSSLSTAEQALVKTAIEAWVRDTADPVSSVLLDSYESDAALAETYVGYSGAADLSTSGSYFRIDGPRVWIEAVVQNGVILQPVHFHTLWRDKVADYGAEFEG
ncbi:MAG: DUF3500 domain-containing protein, partial [Myxococcales bacterium]|nr:DUF3500 domain-containing protein [Myxococcales bacterium]